MAGAAGVVLATVLTGSANADPATGCSSESSGANGLTCAHVGSNLYPGIAANLHLPNITVAPDTAPSCPDATAALVQAHLIVGGANGKGGTSQRLAEATKADAIAHDELAAAVTADTNEDADTTPDADNAALNAAKANLKTAQQADAAEDGNGVAETPSDPADAKLAAARKKANEADKRLAAAQQAEGTAEQGIVDAEVVIGQACPKAPAPFKNCAEANAAGFHDIPATDPHYQPYLDRDHDGIACESSAPPAPPAPPVQQTQPPQPTEIIYPGQPGQPPTADSQTVETHLPVTG